MYRGIADRGNVPGTHIVTGSRKITAQRDLNRAGRLRAGAARGPGDGTANRRVNDRSSGIKKPKKFFLSWIFLQKYSLNTFLGNVSKRLMDAMAGNRLSRPSSDS